MRLLFHCCVLTTYIVNSLPSFHRYGKIQRAVVALEMKNIAVIGAGWAGWGAAKTLCEAGFNVTILDSLPDPAGLEITRTPSGKPFDPVVLIHLNELDYYSRIHMFIRDIKDSG